MATESRLIDANAIYDAVERRYQVSSGIEHRCERDFLDLICMADTVDAIEVIRCHNCQHSEPCKPHKKVWCPRMGRYMKDDAFCSEGVMKDG